MAGGDAPTAAEEPEVDEGFEFAFDNEAFSDKLLRIEVVGTSDEGPGSAADAGSRKRRREEAEGDDGQCISSSRTVMGTQVLRVSTIKVSSVILAAKSPFFFKLFSNGMKESDQRQATLRIADSEENAFMEILRFMYSGKLTPTTEPTLVLDILMAADKFEVISCMKLCGQRLIGLPMTPESAMLCLDLPSSISVPDAVTEAAKKFLVERYEQFLSPKFQDELMRVPLPGIVAILSSNHPGVASEEAVYAFVLRWADMHYPNSEERHKILSSRLLPLVPQVYSMINAIQTDQSSCVVDFTLKHEQCSGLYPSGSIHSPPFHCAGHRFVLSVHCTMEQFLLVVKKLEDNASFREAIDYKLEFKRGSWQECIHTASTNRRVNVGWKGHWSNFINSPWFIDGKLHVRVHVK